MAHVLLLWSVLHEAVTLGCILTGSYCTNIQQLRQIRSIFLFALPEEASVTSCQLTAQNGRLQHRSSKSLCGNVGCIDLVSENHRNYIKIKSLLHWSRNDSFVITACLQACLPQLKLKTPLRKSDESARRFPLDLSGWSNDAVYPKTDSLSYFHFSKAVWANSGFESSHLQFGHG